jgi:hypothetical protein
MKKILITLALYFTASMAFANDLTSVVVNTTVGLTNGSITLTVTGGVSPFTYSWVGPGGYTSTNQNLSGLDSGIYVVTVTDKYCGIATLTVHVGADITIGMNEITNNSYSLFPNPSNEKITVTAASVLNKATIRIVNVVGQTIIEQTNQSGNSFTFDISKEKNGIYFIEINNEGNVSRLRFIKE